MRSTTIAICDRRSNEGGISFAASERIFAYVALEYDLSTSSQSNGHSLLINRLPKVEVALRRQEVSVAVNIIFVANRFVFTTVWRALHSSPSRMLASSPPASRHGSEPKRRGARRPIFLLAATHPD